MVKQVIVVRKDLKMRRGKEIAQGSHASIAWLTRRIVSEMDSNRVTGGIHFSQEEKDWMEGIFTKVCLQVDSEQELRDIHRRALEAGLESHLIIDSGLTEFNGVATPTCVGIGPDDGEKINAITGNLKLY
jgi:PTH2 family peptidyl-tRNA hydrolase